MLGTLWFFVREALESFLDVAVHGDIDVSWMLVVPFEIETTVLLSFAVFCDLVVFFERPYQVLRCCVVRVLDAKVIDCEAEQYLVTVVLE